MMAMAATLAAGGDDYVMHEKVGSISLGRWKKTHSSAAWSISVH